MSAKAKKPLVPRLRFAEYREAGEWERKRLEELSDVVMGQSPKSSSYNEKKIGLPLIQGNADIQNRLSISRIYTSEITKECQINDILLSVRAPVGTVAKSIHNACIGRGISAIRAKSDNSQEFLYQWLFSFESSWQKISQGGTFDAVNSDDIRNLNLPIPKPDEQRKIAACLSSLDDLISAATERLDALKRHKQGLMQQLFPTEGETVPRLRFAEFRDAGEWSNSSLEELYSFKATNSFSREQLNYEIGEVKNIHYGDIHTKFSTSFYIKEESVPYINPTESLEKKKHDCYCEEGDMIFADASEDLNNVGKSIEIVSLNNEKLLSGLHTLLGRQKKSRLVIGFGGYLFKSSRIRTQIKREAQGAKVLGISAARISRIDIAFPINKKEQQKIAACLTALDDLIAAQTQKIAKLKTHKRGLMQQFFPTVDETH